MFEKFMMHYTMDIEDFVIFIFFMLIPFYPKMDNFTSFDKVVKAK